MAIPFNDNLLWNIYETNPDWHKEQPATASAIRENPVNRAAKEVFTQVFKQSVARSFQFVRDAARLVLKVPFRSIWTPIILSKNWSELERSKINAKLTGYSFVHMVLVPVKFLVALAAIATAAVSFKKAEWLLDTSESWTSHLDGRASQLEALKEQGAKLAPTKENYNSYKDWLYGIDAELCRKV